MYTYLDIPLHVLAMCLFIHLGKQVEVFGHGEGIEQYVMLWAQTEMLSNMHHVLCDVESIDPSRSR